MYKYQIMVSSTLPLNLSLDNLKHPDVLMSIKYANGTSFLSNRIFILNNSNRKINRRVSDFS